jgi:hypothetical protein
MASASNAKIGEPRFICHLATEKLSWRAELIRLQDKAEVTEERVQRTLSILKGIQKPLFAVHKINGLFSE